MPKDKGTHGTDKKEMSKLTPDKVININEGIQSLLDPQAAENLDQLRKQMISCCLQACDCCLQIS